MKQYKFKTDPLSPNELQDIEILHLGIGGLLGCFALSRLMLSRLCDPNNYDEISYLSDEDQQLILRQLYEVLNEAYVWTMHSKN